MSRLKTVIVFSEGDAAYRLVPSELIDMFDTPASPYTVNRPSDMYPANESAPVLESLKNIVNLFSDFAAA